MTRTYISVDLETDGVNLRDNSVIAIGAWAVGTRKTFYSELSPVSHHCSVDVEAMAVNGLDWNRLEREAPFPEDVVPKFNRWVAQFDNPVFVAWPLGFDWSFYQIARAEYDSGASPFGHGSALDIKTLAWAVRGADVTKSGLMEAYRIKPGKKHNALADAKAQGQLFARLWEEAGRSL